MMISFRARGREAGIGARWTCGPSSSLACTAVADELRLADDLKLIALNNELLDVSRTSARLSVLQPAERLKEHDQCASQALPLRTSYGWRMARWPHACVALPAGFMVK
jgi:hypothetical protein